MIHIQKHDGVEMSLEDVSISSGSHELPPTRGGLRDRSDINLSVPYPSPDFDVLLELSESQKPVGLRRGDHVTKWILEDPVALRLKAAEGDGVLSLKLTAAGGV